MILHGNQRGHGQELAVHLLKDENEIVEIHDMRGFLARDIEGAFNEIYALSRGTKCDDYLYSLSLNPPIGADVSVAEFETAIERAEKKLGLTNQPRAVVFHTKNGRKHAHVVWSRIDIGTMKARNMAFDKEKLTAISRELFREYGWEMPTGLQKRGDRSPINYTHAEHQQAQRVGKHAGDIKADIQAAWAQSDTKAAFEHALIERGYMLARGDRRGFVILDGQGEIYSLPRLLGIKTKIVRERLGDEAELPSVEIVKSKLAEIAKDTPPPQKPKRKDFTAKEAYTEITNHHAAFTRKMMERALKPRVSDDGKRKEMIEHLLKSPTIKEIGKHDGETMYVSNTMIALEKNMVKTAASLDNAPSYRMDNHCIQRAIFNMNAKLGKETDGKASLSQEQLAAIRHMIAGKGLSLVVGVAGAGKTTIMEAAKDALEMQGYRVRGAAPSGIAAASLKDIGMNASTLHALEARLQIVDDILEKAQGKPLTPKQQALVKNTMLTKHDVIIVDEAGMVGVKHMEKLLRRAEQAGAKIVLVGDPEQLQSIEAGTAFKTLLERHNHAKLTEVRRQKSAWQRAASIQFSEGNIADALNAFKKNGDIIQTKERGDAADQLVQDYMASYRKNPDASRLALAYTRADVATLNAAIRAEMVKSGRIAETATSLQTTLKDKNGDITETHSFAARDRILFRENNATLGVMNGSFGTIEKVSDLRMTVKLDNGKSVKFSPKEYTAFQHGYAATVHKSQGMTVDECYALASPLFDRHTTYVAMTRHKHTAKLYAAKNDFRHKQTLESVLGRESEKLSTLDFIGKQKSLNKPSLGKRLSNACKQTVRRIIGGEKQDKPHKQDADQTIHPTPTHREYSNKTAQRDAVLNANRPETPPPPHLSARTSTTKSKNIVALRDEFLKQTAERKHVQAQEADRNHHDNTPTLER